LNAAQDYIVLCATAKGIITIDPLAAFPTAFYNQLWVNTKMTAWKGNHEEYSELRENQKPLP
jgi:hypothetical protein